MREAVDVRQHDNPLPCFREKHRLCELGYLPNGLAQGLRRSRSRVVGLCVPDSSSNYFAALIDTVEDIAADQGYEVMQVLSRHSSGVEQNRVRALLSHRIAGLL
jgi:LacI family transcriptional regulator